MKGRKQFTLTEEKKLVSLIAKKTTATRPEQKTSRQAMRDIGFYISDFTKSSKGFTVEDFKYLKKTGKIKVA